MKQAEYVEWIPTGRFVKGVISATISLIIIVLAMIVIFVKPLDLEAIIGVGVSLVVLMLIMLLFVNFRGLEIKIDSRSLSASYGLLNNKCVNLDEIVSCKIVKATFSRYGGIGVRYGLDGSYAYTTSFGNAVEITPKKGRPFVFSTKNPDKICALIREIGKEN